MIFHVIARHSRLFSHLKLQDILGIGNLIAVSVTGVIVWIYTKAAQRSNEIQEEPFINFSFEETKTNGSSRTGELRVKNIGKGPAYNVRFERFDVQGYSYRLFLENPVLESQEMQLLKGAVRTPTGGTQGLDMMWFLERFMQGPLTPETIERMKSNPVIFVAHCEGANGKTYHSAFAFYCTIPPVGSMIMQFLTRGKGQLSLEDAKQFWDRSDRIKSSFED